MITKRQQAIIQGAIDLIQSHGYPAFSYGDLAKHLTISKGVLTYHYAHKLLLTDAVVDFIIADYSNYILDRLNKNKQDPVSLLHTYIKSVLTYAYHQPVYISVLMEIGSCARNADGSLRYGKDIRQQALDGIGQLLNMGQIAGVFVVRDTPVTALLIKGTLDEYIRSCFDSSIVAREGPISPPKQLNQAIRSITGIIDDLVLNQK